MPELYAGSQMVLTAQGLPFAVVGVGDLLALFRCVSVRYRFSTDYLKPSLMGAIGRVFASLEVSGVSERRRKSESGERWVWGGRARWEKPKRALGASKGADEALGA